jgi:hypothetical protein
MLRANCRNQYRLPCVAGQDHFDSFLLAGGVGGVPDAFVLDDNLLRRALLPKTY